ncbi:MAG: hypothetical protein ABH867_03270 [Patescibacteria group bacterium]|nr:hypothetical protein [Patescibacteria group bacterium]
MIFKAIKKNPVDFAILGAVFALMIFGFIRSAYNPGLQGKIIILTGVLYSLWGVFHHWHRGDLCLKIVLEYLLLSALGVTAVFFVVLRH